MTVHPQAQIRFDDEGALASIETAPTPRQQSIASDAQPSLDKLRNRSLRFHDRLPVDEQLPKNRPPLPPQDQLLL